MMNVKLNEFTSAELQWLFDTVVEKGKNVSLTDEDLVTAGLWITQLSQAIEERNRFELEAMN